MKLGPPAIMLTVLGLTVWLMISLQGTVKIDPGSTPIDMVIAHRKVTVEMQPDQTAAPGEAPFRYRFHRWPQMEGRWLTAVEFQEALREHGMTKASKPFALRFFNVSDWANLMWVALGLGGQVLFAGRMLVQWIASERRRESFVPPVFWYMSLTGGAALMTYFIWRQDIVGVIGQSTGLVVYARNIRLIRKRAKSGLLPAVAADETAADAEGHAVAADAPGHPRPAGATPG